MIDYLLDFSGISVNENEKKKKEQSDGIAIIGMTGSFANAEETKDFFDALLKGRDLVREIPLKRFEAVKDYIPGNKRVCRAGYSEDISCFDHEFFGISYNEACFTDPQQRLFLEAVYHALENAGYANESLKGARCGVYAGQSADLSVEYSVLVEKAIPERYSEISVPGNIRSVMAGRIAYYFDLHGPAMIIDTACSSALTAVCAACDAIRNGQIDMAIAGGVKADIFPVMEGLDNEIGIRSSRDLLKTFDDSSDGISSGEGCAVIILKDLKKAIEDGDHIHAVIRGYAVNNDGNSIGVTAPNPVAQQDAICRAWEMSGIDPEDLDYVETHGTGTRLGDPIEVEGLTKAFNKYTDKKSFCGVGSVKTNIGHLDNLAGIAGLFKVVEILKTGVIPPSLHFERPNRNIDFVDSALYVTDSYEKLSEKDRPYLCGINSFGLAGTNCHMVLEQYKASTYEQKDENEQKQLFVLSARNPDVLLELCRNNFEQIRLSSDSLSDICYTAMSGRYSYEYRISLMVCSKEELVNELEKVIASGKTAFSKIDRNISRQQEQKMQELSLLFMEFREESVIEKIRSLYLEGTALLPEILYEGIEVHRCELPVYPFKRTRCWIPTDSSNKDSLIDKCLVRTGNLMVYETEFSEKSHWVLREHKVNGKYILPGTAYIASLFSILDQLSQEMKTVSIKNMFYLQPVVLNKGEARKVIFSLRRQEDDIIFEIGSFENKDNDEKWILHAIGSIGFSDKEGNEIKKIKSDDQGEAVEERSITVDIGKHWTDLERKVCKISESEYETYFGIPEASAFEAQKTRIYAPALDRAMNVVNAIAGEGTYLPFSFAELELYENMPLSFYSDTVIKEVKDSMIRVDVSLYDTAGKVFCNIKDFIVKGITEAGDAFEKTSPVQLSRLTWIEMPLGSQEESPQKKKYICISGGEKVSERIENLVKESFASAEFAFTHSCEAVLNNCKAASRIVIIAAFSGKESVYELLDLVKKVEKAGISSRTEIVLISGAADKVVDTDTEILPENTALKGASITVMQEFPDMLCRFIDWDRNTEPENIVREIRNQEFVGECAYRNGIRYTKVLKSVRSEEVFGSADRKLQKDGAYIITGGSGDLGMAAGRRIAAAGGKVVLLGRRNTLDIKREDSSNISYSQCDVTNREELENKLETIREQHGRINGIIHSAGIVRDNLILMKSASEVQEVFAPKAVGAELLYELTKEDGTDFFIVYSSISALTGGAGQFDYAAANAYLNGFAQEKEGVIAIDWAAWDEIGMSAKANLSDDKHSFKKLKPSKALDALEKIMTYGCKEKVVVIGTPNKVVLEKLINKPLFSDVQNHRQTKSFLLRKSEKKLVKEQDIIFEGSDSLTQTEKIVARAWRDVLGNESISINENFDQLGGDSIMAVRLLTKLNQSFDGLDITMVYTYPTIQKMAAYIDRLNDHQPKETPVAREDIGMLEDIDKILEQLENREIMVSDAVMKLS
ncbi:MAG: SDR family NAD(P)-dependent oxidoreductase [Lachnospiraceae bacterium]|nr:SDR family NAD(P)-dependent oxidoreductase [Lachnospiraceae bacterium]